ncbi:MAG: tRNA (guanosine(37)-N1)-methyltransferase TrmD [Lachnospiraceae bacterium]|nr:tRNA (guanosine(37)-N1)-methyltransferase TrmD [Lachnospiraceae bacterium]
MIYHVITLFPDLIRTAMETSVIGRAMEKGLISLDTIQLRDYAGNRYGAVDDYTYGGGAGLLIRCEPVFLAYREAMSRAGFGFPEEDDKKSIQSYRSLGQPVLADTPNSDEGNFCQNISSADRPPRVIFTSPGGKTFTEETARELSHEEQLIFICGHYEGVDERVLEEIVTDDYSIGDYVLTGGELPVIVMMDAISRLIPGALHNEESAETDSFENGLIEYPQFTRPQNWRGKEVPEILLSGDHAKVNKWRFHESLLRTKAQRPELYRKWLHDRGIY